MLKIEEVEPIVRGAVEGAINAGYLLISKDWGVCWDAEAGLWVWDRNQTYVRSCCVAGAFLLMMQPAVDPSLHKGDAFDAVKIALSCDRWWLRDFLNGCDGWPMQEGQDPAVYEFGVTFNQRYRPMDIDILDLVYQRQDISETRLRVVPALDSEQELLEAPAR